MPNKASLNEKAEDQLIEQAKELEQTPAPKGAAASVAERVGAQQLEAVAPPVESGQKELIDSAGRPAQPHRDQQAAAPTSAASNQTQVPGGRYKRGNSIYNAWGEKIG